MHVEGEWLCTQRPGREERCRIEKEGGEAFTSKDEEVLMLFASQAATAIANARTYRDGQRAPADLKALVKTSPIGVPVFDARTAEVLCLNLEAKRIVGSLCHGRAVPGAAPRSPHLPARRPG